MFTTEKDLVSILKSNYTNMCDWDTNNIETKVLDEVNLGFGIADLVISTLDRINPNKKIAFNYFDITIYKIIEIKGSVSLNEIKDITKSNSSNIKKSLEKLIIESHINQEDSFYVISNKYNNVSIKTVAIEAKLKNWKRALNQAFRYKWFASIVYVVLDSKNVTPAAKNIDFFQKLNVGLASIDKQGELIIIFKPFLQNPIDEKMQMLLSEHIIQNLDR